VLGQVLGQKKSETCWGLNTGSVGNMLNFPTAIQTHVFNKRNNSYGYLNTANVRRLAGR
jgi:hypothetical protein